MKFLNILLKEGRKEDLKKKYYDDFDEEDLDFILGISDLQDFNHKYTDWVLKNILAYDDVDMMAEFAVNLVKDFDKYQKQLEKKDINQYRSFEELEKTLGPFKEKEKERELENQTEKIYEDDNFLVLIPKTQEASCKYGAGTKWCTTVKNSDHFDRYTRGKQGLYYILRKKGKGTESHYKVAVHFDEYRNEKWWDAIDRPMTDSSIELFKEYFPDLYQSIINDYDEKTKIDLKELNSIFSIQDQEIQVDENFHGVVNKDLTIAITGYDLITDMLGKAMGNLKIFVNKDLIDEYDIYVNYSAMGTSQWTASVGFGEDFDEEPKFDFELWKGWGVDLTMPFQDTKEVMRRRFDKILMQKIYHKIHQSEGFHKYLKNITGPVWYPNRIDYGYTFAKKDKGLIKKLVDYLDAGYDNGTKLDFLEYIKKLKSRTRNGKKEYSHSKLDNYYPAGQFRGHFSSFFASAKHAGIIQYQKEGNKFIIKPGPNFDAFKKGELKVL